MKKQTCSNICAYLIAVVIMVNCRSVWLSNPSWTSVLNMGLYLILVCGSICLLLINFDSINNLKSTILVSLFVFLYFFVYLLFNSVNLKSNLLLLIILILFLWIVQIKGKKLPIILEAYSNVIVLIAAISILMWLTCSLLKLMSPSGYVQFNWTSTEGIYKLIPTYKNIYFETQDITLPVVGNIIRNTAIFTEAPMASLNFCLAFLIKIVMRSKTKTTIWLIIAILTTFSTTGYILLILIFFLKWLETNKNQFIYKLLFMVPVLIIAIIGINLLIGQRATYGTQSTSLRLDDYKVGLTTFLQHPLFGAGLGNSMALTENMSSWRWRISMIGFSNSIAEVLAQGGIYVSIAYMYAFIRGLYLTIKFKSLDNFILILGTFYLFCTTIFSYQYILLLLLVLFAKFEIYLKIEDKLD